MKSRSCRKLAMTMVSERLVPRRTARSACRSSASSIEHLEHAVGDEETTDDVDRPEDDRDRPRELDQRGRTLGADDEQVARQHDPVDRFRERHQRGVQHRRHLRDHLETDEHRKDEDRDLIDQAHGAPPAVAGAPTASRTRSFTIWPSCVTAAPAVISSSKSSASSPSGARWVRRFTTLFAYSRLEWKGIWLGRLSVASIVTPSFTVTVPGAVSSQFPPVSAAMSTTTEPGRMARTISALTSLGAGRPGTAAVVITMSAAATRSA